jgi:hypothetical protein
LSPCCFVRWLSPLSDQITFQAAGYSAHLPLVMGLFGAIGLAAMVLAVKR